MDRQELVFQTRLGGDDFGKARLAYHVSWPPELAPILKHLVDHRQDGPLIVRRPIAGGRCKRVLTATSTEEITGHFNKVLAAAPPGEVESEQDRKRLYRRLLRQLGGVSEDALAREFKKLIAEIAPGKPIRFYDLRGSVTTDLKDAGVDAVFRRYITGHSLRGDILAHYESQDVHLHMTKYFTYIKPLLSAIVKRTAELGI